MSLSDAELIARALVADDHEAFGQLVARHQAPLRAWLRRLANGDHARGDDLAQETFLAAHRQLKTFRHEGRFATWLFSIAYNCFRADARKRREFVELDDAMVESLPAAPEPGSAELRQELGEALARLSAEQRAAITLCYQQGLTREEAAVVMQCPAATVKTHILRGKERLLRYFQTADKALR